MCIIRERDINKGYPLCFVSVAARGAVPCRKALDCTGISTLGDARASTNESTNEHEEKISFVNAKGAQKSI